MNLFSHLALLPHPEGGHYREYYRSDVTVAGEALPEGYAGARVACTAIYFLLEAGEKSHLHRLKGDEIWHFYAGGPLDLFLIRPDGQLEQRRLGVRLDAGECFQTVVPAGTWFAATPAPGSEYALCGCTMAPGFDFADFELAARADLLAEYPQHSAFIQEFCLR
jgi:uncharacterized protein